MLSPETVLETGQLHGALTSEAAQRHFTPFRVLLTEVLKHHTTDTAHVALAIMAALNDHVP